MTRYLLEDEHDHSAHDHSAPTPSTPTESTSTSSSAHAGHGMSSGGEAGTSMPMYFMKGYVLQLWLKDFDITSKGGYAAAMIGLFIMCLVHESLLALRTHLNQAYYPCGEDPNAKQPVPKGCEDGCCSGDKPPRRYYDYYVSRFQQFIDRTGEHKRFIISALYGVNVFMSYLLMLAVMTMNVGFFFIIVGGLAMGHYIFFRKPGKSDSPLLQRETGDGCGCGC